MVTQAEVEKEEKRATVAVHALIDSQGDEVDSEESADGISYTLKANDETFTWSWTKANEAERRMIALFGAKTLATNERSASNQQGGTPDEQIAAIRDRFALIAGGEWVDRTREGPKVDLPTLATALVKVMIDLGKATVATESATYAEALKRLTEDPKYVKTVRSFGPVTAKYAELRGRPTVSIDDILPS